MSMIRHVSPMRYTQKQVDYMIHESNRKMLTKIIRDFTIIITSALKHKLGFGSKRIYNFTSYINDLFDEMYNQDLTVEDVEKTIEK